MSPTALRKLDIISVSAVCLGLSTLCGNDVKDKATLPFSFSVQITAAIDTILQIEVLS